MSFETVLAETTRALGWTLVHTLWQGALVAAVYSAFRGAARGCDVRLRYAAGLVALAMMLALPVATLWSLLWAPGAASAGGLPIGGADGAPALASRIEAWLPIVVLAWGFGVLAMAAREAWRFRAMRAVLLGSAVDLDEWTARAARIARRLGVSRRVRVVSSALARTPSLVGWLAPVVVLPASALLALSPRQLEMVIAHELAHVRRGDYLVNLLQVAVETLLFHHPAVHWISRDVRELREACCDDLVLRSGVDPLHYADTLASLEELRGRTHAPALAASGGTLLLRVKRIVGVGGEAPPRLDGQAVVLAAGLLALVLMMARHEPVDAPGTPAVALAQGAVATIVATAALAPDEPAAVATVPAPHIVAHRTTSPEGSPARSRAAENRARAPRVDAPAPPIARAPSPPITVALAPPPPDEQLGVGDLRTRRQVIRPFIVLVGESPDTCVRRIGSRLCRSWSSSGLLDATIADDATAEQVRSASPDGASTVPAARMAGG